MEAIGSAFDDLIQEMGIRSKIDRARLEEDWDEIVGEFLSGHLSVVSFTEHGQLTLKAENPSWSQQASMLREEIKESINSHFGYELVNSIRVTN